MKKQQQKTMKRIGVMPTALAMAISSVAATQAFAETPNHKFGVYLRSDLVMNSNDNDADTNDDGDSTRFQINSIRMNWAGDLNDKTSYRVRYRLHKSADVSEKDNTPSALDYAYLDRKVSDTVKIRAGKHFLPASGGREGDYSGLDVYLYSMAGDNVLAYETGVTGMFDVAGQSLSLSVFNGAGETNQSGLGYGVGYYGDFANGMVQPIASYYVVNSTEQEAVTDVLDDPTTSKDESVIGSAEKDAQTNAYLSAGVRVNFAPAHVEVDYINIVSGAFVDGAEDQAITSIVAKAGADLMGGSVKPQLKFESSKIENAAYVDGADLDRTGISAAVEYYPEPEWRVHAAYTTYTDAPDADGAEDIKTDQIILGFSFIFTNG